MAEKRSTLTKFVFAFLACLSVFTFAQSKDPYADQGYVYEKVLTTVSFADSGDFVRTDRITVAIKSEAGLKEWTSIRGGYAAEHQDFSYRFVRVIKANGTTVETPLDFVQDLPAPITQQAPWYSDLHEKHVVVRALNVGDRLEYEVETKSKKPEIPGQFWFDYSFEHDAIVLDQTLRITIPAARTIQIRYSSDPRVTTTDKTKTYEFSERNLLTKKDEEADPHKTEFMKDPADIQLSTFIDWSQLGTWYAELEKPSLAVTPEITAKAAELTKGLQTPAEKVKALHRFVATQIRYVAIEFGIGRYQPHRAADILANGYGDCKDKHTLLAALLAASGFKADAVLIHTTIDTDIGVPTLSAFNHVITLATIDGVPTWLDSTAEVLPFGFVPKYLRDKDSLVVSSTPHIVRTPAKPSIAALETFDIDSEIDASAGTLKGKVVRQFRGDSAWPLRMVFRSLPANKWSDVVQGISYGTGFAGKVDDVVIEGLEDPEQPLKIRYDYTREEYPGARTWKVGAALPITMRTVTDLKKKKNGIPLNGGRVEFTSRLRLPSDARPSLPQDVLVKQTFGEYRAQYRVLDGFLVTSRVLDLKEQIIEPSDFDTFERFTTSVSDDYDRRIDVRSSFGSVNGTEVAVDKDDLFRSGQKAYQAGNTQEGLKVFKKLVELDPKYPNAWSMIGAGYFMTNDVDRGVSSMKKEIEANPREASMAYTALDGFYRSTQQFKAAREMWEGLLKVSPNDSRAINALGPLYSIEKRYADAAKMYEAALKDNPKQIGLLMGLGGAQLQSDDKERAYSTYKSVVELDSRPAVLNDAAYSLIEANVHVPEAIEWSKRSVHELAKASTEVILSRVLDEDAANVTLLAASWDTLGWGYFRAGDNVTAEKFLRAAWDLSQFTAVGNHLAKVLASTGRAKDAQEFERLSAIEHTTIKPPAFLGANAKPMITTARPGGDTLSNMRTFKITGAPRSASGSGELLLLFANSSQPGEIKWLRGAALQDLEPKIKEMSFHVTFPDDSPTKILRRGVLYCGAAGCHITLIPIDSVRSVE
jgi:tetratricopeptide (TPR) repeat protein